ncbi:MAG: NYN domain-containing protein [Candidatus ainarchaeum sp.]|nr:NYN domain-containing protein [Candidatus ainarchaeum sp.]
MKQAILFVDSSNVYHALKEEKMLDSFSYKWLFEELSKKFQINKVYFYDAVKNEKIEPIGFRKQQKFHANLEKEIPNIIISHRKLKYDNVEKRIKDAKDRSDFCESCKNKIQDFLKIAGLTKISHEKGVDVMLVTDMIKNAFQDKFQTALLFSGDADFIPAIELVKNLKKDVINIHLYSGSARELRLACDNHILVGKDSNNNLFIN